MKILRHVFGHCLLLSLIFVCFPQVSFASAPEISVDGQVHDFGTVDSGFLVEHSFVLSNTGSEELEIRSVTSDCGCTVATLETRSILPGDSVPLPVTFDTTNFHGSKVKAVRVSSNDPKNATLVLKLKGNITQSVSVNPPRLFFGVIQSGTSPSLSFDVQLNKPDISVEKVMSKSPALSIEKKGALSYTVKLAPDLPEGNFRTDVVVQVPAAKPSAVVVPVFARVRGPLWLSPKEVSYGLLPAPLENDLAQKVKLQQLNGSGARILTAISENPSITATVEDDTSLMITLLSGSQGIVRGRVLVTAKLSETEEVKELVLPVYAIIEPQGE